MEVQSAAVELSGNAETIPESGFIELQGKELLLHGVQIIHQNATCKDSNGQWSCGKLAWETLKNKLDSEPVLVALQNLERSIDQLRGPNQKVWLKWSTDALVVLPRD